jgi:hypothetical protein
VGHRQPHLDALREARPRRIDMILGKRTGTALMGVNPAGTGRARLQS